ncbi:MAG: rhodanese-like domain-containing protein, partial [Aquificaceae bacterium]
AIVLYCDGIYCGKSKRVAKELSKEGFTNVSRYQLGIPVWLSLGNITQCELDGIKYIYENDKTAWFIDSRKAEDFSKGSLKIAKNIPFDGVMDGKDVGEIFKAKEDGRLPVDDRNTRIIVFGDNINAIKQVADGLAKEAFHNVCYYAGDAKDIIGLSEKK